MVTGCRPGSFSRLMEILDEIESKIGVVQVPSYATYKIRRQVRELAQRASAECNCLLSAVSTRDYCARDYEEYKQLYSKGMRVAEKVSQVYNLGLKINPRSHSVTLTLGEVFIGGVECRKVAPLVRDLCSVLEVLASLL